MPRSSKPTKPLVTIIIAVLFSLAATACKQKAPKDTASATKPKAPLASYDETSFDFGKVTRGDDVSHSFVIENKGTAQLKLLGTRSTCPCLIPHLTGTDIAPGETGRLILRLNTSRQKGKLQQTVKLKTNDPKHASISFKVYGEVQVLAAFEPDVVSLGDVLKSSTKSIEIHLTGSEISKMKPGEFVSSDPEHISASFKKGSREKIEIKVKAPDKEGRISGFIRLLTGLDRPKEIKLKVIARVTSDLVTDRTYALFSDRVFADGGGKDDKNKQPVYVVHVRSLSNKAFKITKVRDVQGVVTGRAEPTKGGWKVELKLSKKPSQKRGEVLLDTDRKDQPTLSVKYIIRSDKDLKNRTRPRLNTQPVTGKPLMRIEPKDIPATKGKKRIELNDKVRHQASKIRRLEPGGMKKYPPPGMKSNLNSDKDSK